MTRTSVEELVEVVRPRYVKADRSQKSQILDEFVAVTGFHRKAAIRRLRGGRRRTGRRRRRPPPCVHSRCRSRTACCLGSVRLYLFQAPRSIPSGSRRTPRPRRRMNRPGFSGGFMA